MVNEDILRGLEGGMARGETLEQAMYSFYNAGYKKEEIEEAARALSTHLSQQESLIPTKPVSISKPAGKKPTPKKPSFISFTKRPTLQPVQQKPEQKPAPKVVQSVSSYETKYKSPRKILIIILSVFLVILLGILISIFLFRNSLLSFFDKFF